MRIVAIIQARMGSTRLPGKVLLDIAGQTMLARVVHRTRRSTQLSDVVVATSTLPSDDAIVAECARLNAPVARGSEQDVLARYHQAAVEHRADVVVRITSDCPMIDPEVIDRVVAAYLAKRPDYASNTLQRSYPRGLDVEVMSMEALATAWREAVEPEERIHVTPFLYRHPERFELAKVVAPADMSASRWTVDTPEDLAFARALYGLVDGAPDAPWETLLAAERNHPEIRSLNREIRQKSLEEG